MERWDAYDRNGQKLNRLLIRGEPVPDGTYHLVVTVLVQHMDGTFLIMRRDEHKETWPGVYEASAGGSVLAGEESLEAARRELAEETGIAGGVFTPLYFDRGLHALYHGFLCRTDYPKDAVTLQEGETIGFRWISGEELLAMDARRPIELVLQRGVKNWFAGANAPVDLR